MIPLEEKKEIITNTEIFSGIPETYAEAIARRTGEKKFLDGEYLFKEEDRGDHMLIIHRGQVEIIKSESIILAVLAEGDVLGEMAPISRERRSTSAKAKGDVDVLFLKGEALRILMHKIPDLSLALLRMTIRRLKLANDLIRSLEEDLKGGGIKYSLLVENGPQKGQTAVLPKNILIGRGDPGQKQAGRLNLQGGSKTKISRRHAEVFFRRGNYFVRDMDSTNGVFLNGHRIKEIISLVEGDQLQIGGVSLKFFKS